MGTKQIAHQKSHINTILCVIAKVKRSMAEHSVEALDIYLRLSTDRVSSCAMMIMNRISTVPFCLITYVQDNLAE